jgi:hypothetical protein
VSFRSQLVHSLALVAPTDAGTIDADGQPVAGDPIVTAVPGLIQPQSVLARARDRALEGEAGPRIGSHVIFLELVDIPAGAWISDNPADVDAGQRYDITGVRRYEFGGTPHLEIDAQLVTSEQLVAAP